MSIDIITVQVLIGDEAGTEISPASIAVLNSLYGDNPFTVAAAAVRAIAAKYAGSVTKKSGDVSINSSDKHTQYLTLAKELDRKAVLFGLGGASIYAGGISASDKLAQEADDDRTDPYFTRTTGNDNNNALGADALLLNE